MQKYHIILTASDSIPGVAKLTKISYISIKFVNFGTLKQTCGYQILFAEKKFMYNFFFPVSCTNDIKARQPQPGHISSIHALYNINLLQTRILLVRLWGLNAKMWSEDVDWILIQVMIQWRNFPSVVLSHLVPLYISWPVTWLTVSQQELHEVNQAAILLADCLYNDITDEQLGITLQISINALYLGVKWGIS
jgi:hypothetical protein